MTRSSDLVCLEYGMGVEGRESEDTERGRRCIQKISLLFLIDFY